MKIIKILMLCLLTTMSYAQKKLSKTSQSIKVNKDVIIDLNTSYAEIEIDTWNKDIVEIEAYIESDELSKEELEQALDAWRLNVEGSNDRVSISSTGGRAIGLYSDGNYASILRDLEFELADLPEVSEIVVIPELPELGEFPEMPQLPAMPEMPKFPELPELPDGVTTIKFDYDRYQNEGETYLKEWSERYEKEGGKALQQSMEAWAKKFAESGYQEKMQKWGEEYGKRFDGKWAEDMEAWGEKFGEKYAKDMEKWGEEFGKKFDKEWAKKMEAWGKEFEEKMKRQAELNEKISRRTARKIEKEALKQVQREERKAILLERQAERKAALQERKSEMKKRLEERRDALEERKAAIEERKDAIRERNAYAKARYLDAGRNDKVKKVIKIKIPKKAKLKTDIRHGELKLSSVMYNMSGNLSHTFLVADNIDGSETSINVSYAPVIIDTWNMGTLNLNYVDKAQIKNANNLVLNSKSSNISVQNLTDIGIIDGSFGDLTIANLASSFKTLNLILENSDALINLPQNVNYNMYFKGDRSKFNNKTTSQKTIRNYPEGQSTDKTISVNAKYSSVIMN